MSCRAAAKRHHFHRTHSLECGGVGGWRRRGARCHLSAPTCRTIGALLDGQRALYVLTRRRGANAAHYIYCQATPGCEGMFEQAGGPHRAVLADMVYRYAYRYFHLTNFSPSVCPPNAQVAAVLFARVVHGLVVTAVPGPHDPRHRPTVLAAVPRLQCQAQQNSSTNSLATVPRTSVHSCRVRLSPNVSQLLRRSHPALSCGR